MCIDMYMYMHDNGRVRDGVSKIFWKKANPVSKAQKSLKAALKSSVKGLGREFERNSAHSVLAREAGAFAVWKSNAADHKSQYKQNHFSR